MTDEAALLSVALQKIWTNGSPVLVWRTSSMSPEQKAKVRMTKRPRQAFGATDQMMTLGRVIDAS